MNGKNLNDDSIDLLQLLKFFLSKIWLAIILVIVCSGVAFSIAKFKMPLKYQSSISMYVKSSDKSSVEISQSDISVAKSLVSTYIVVLQDDTVMEQVGDELLKRYSTDFIEKCFSITTSDDGETKVSTSDIKNSLSMSSVDSTEVLRVSAETKDPEMSAVLCNIIAEKAQTVLVRVVGAGSVEVIGAAKVSTSPSSPDVTKITLEGALLGFIVAALIVFMIYFLDNTIKSPEDVERRFAKPTLGEIRDFSCDGKKKKNIDILEENFPFVVKESYKSMRTNLMFALSAKNKKIITVSSSNAHEGKSVTSANIALSFAKADKKVLLIDADLRNPTQHKLFHLKNKIGLSNIIGNLNSFEECVQKAIIENLDILPSGAKPPNPSELLGSENASNLFEYLTEIYDYVIIDTPPINVVSDAMNIKSEVSGMILVLRYGVTTFEDVSRAMKSFELANENLLGMVINGIQHKRDGSYYSDCKMSSYAAYENANK